MRFRDAEPGDVEHIARLHADSWRRHYRGAFPDSYLDGDIVGDRIAVWLERLAPPAANTNTTVVEIEDELAGFVHTIFDEDPKWGALVDNLHVAYTRQRAGLGSRLMAEAASAVLASSAADRPALVGARTERGRTRLLRRGVAVSRSSTSPRARRRADRPHPSCALRGPTPRSCSPPEAGASSG